MHEVGALLDASYMHPTRKAKFHLRSMAASNGIGKKRVDEVLDLVGLSEVANKRVGKFSLGMKQRVGIAGALLGDPETVLFDEPANGLDPEGVHWIRNFLSHLADEGRTVFVSSHLLSEMSLMADQLIIIGGGKLIADTTVSALTSQMSGAAVIVDSPSLDLLQSVLQEKKIPFRNENSLLVIPEEQSETIGHLAFENNIEIHQLYRSQPSLEDAFLEITKSAQEFTTHPEMELNPNSDEESKNA